VASYPDTHLRDAVQEAMQQHLAPFQGRKCILLLSDGQDVASRLSASELMEDIFGSDTVIYPIYYRVDPRELMKKLFGVTTRAPYDQNSTGGPNKNYQEYEAQGEEFLRKLAEESAGRIFAADVDKLDRAFEQITRELSHQYLLGFYPGEASIDGRLHLLTVKVSRPGVTVRARRSYRASPPGSGKPQQRGAPIRSERQELPHADQYYRRRPEAAFIRVRAEGETSRS
jgi:Ca-activated chloride channel family protein